MINSHIVIIEDEEDLLELLEYRLQKEGYDVTGFLKTNKVEEFLSQEDVNLLIVDRNLSGIEGSLFVKSLRDMGYKIPVIFVSAKDSDLDIEEGFLKGGDDYITKPYNMNELILRVKSLLRRTNREDAGKLIYKDIILDLDERVTYVDGKKVGLSKLEFELLSYFIQNKNIVLDRSQLLQEVWIDEDCKQEKTVNVTINRLKNKIDPNKSKEYIQPIRGIGYKFC